MIHVHPLTPIRVFFQNYPGYTNCMCSDMCPPMLLLLLLAAAGSIQAVPQECPPGTYISDTLECVKCKRGMHSTEVGAVSAKACKNCPEVTYTTDGFTCVICPSNTRSPAGAFGVLECTSNPGYYATKGGAGEKCPVNFYCIQGTTKPTPCPPGTISASAAAQCKPGIQSVALLDWIVAFAWIAMFSGGVVALGLFKHKTDALRDTKGESMPSHIQIQIVR